MAFEPNLSKLDKRRINSHCSVEMLSENYHTMGATFSLYRLYNRKKLNSLRDNKRIRKWTITSTTSRSRMPTKIRKS